jgi:hypothetical protein
MNEGPGFGRGHAEVFAPLPERKDPMLFLTRFTFTPEARGAIITRFKETKGLPPSGVKMLGRWHVVAGGCGFHLSEASDASALLKWTLQWSDLMTIDIYPVVDDQQMAALL